MFAMTKSIHRCLGLPMVATWLILLIAGCSHEAPRDLLAPTTVPVASGQEAAKARMDTFVVRAYSIDEVYLAGNVNDWNDADPHWQLALQPALSVAQC